MLCHLYKSPQLCHTPRVIARAHTSYGYDEVILLSPRSSHSSHSKPGRKRKLTLTPLSAIQVLPAPSIKALFKAVVSQDPLRVQAMIERGLTTGDPTKAYPYIQLAAHYLDGKPVETVKHQGDAQQPMRVIFELHRLSDSAVTLPSSTSSIKALP